MASETATPVQPPPLPGPSPDAAEHEALIDRRLRSTGRQVKGVDLASGIITLAVTLLGYLFVAAVLDHWVFSGGLGFLGRLVLFLGLISVAGTLFARGVLPPLLYRINPIFAAQTVEQARPSLKNGLVNLLFLRAERAQHPDDPLSQRVYQGLQHDTASEVSQISAENVVDRAHLIRLGYVLAGVLGLAALYLVFSPKNPLTSFGRVALPWADISVPTRVTIEDVKPMDSMQYRGQMLPVSARVDGLGADEEVLLYYTTTDGQAVDQAIPLRLPEGKSRHECRLPPGKLGLQQDLRYYLAAGDCRTPEYSVEVLAIPSILVDSVRLEYPPYTGMEPREQRGGDIRDIEGTRVIIRATANDQIARAAIEMDCDPRKSIRMRASGSEATGEFRLAVDRDDPSQSGHRGTYQLRFTEAGSGKNRENPEPIRHRIEVIADRAPEVRFVDPPPEESQLPVNATLTLRVFAEDPDFALRRVVLRMECEGKSLMIAPLVDLPKPQPALEGPAETEYSFKPSALGLKPEDLVAYWAEAYDNKEPVHNRSQTSRRQITITADDGTPSAEKSPEADGGQKGHPESDSRPPEAQDPGNPPQDPAEPDSPDQPQEKMENGADKPEDPAEQQPGDQSQAEDDPPSNPQQGEQQEQPANGLEQSGMESGQQEGQEGDQSQSGAAGGEAQPSEPGSNADPSQGAKGGDSPSENNAEGGQTAGSNSSGQSGDKGESQGRQKPVNGDSNPGEAFEKVLEQMEKDRGEKSSNQEGDSAGQPEPSTGDGQPGDEKSAGGDEKSAGSEQKPRSEPGESQSGQPGSPQDAKSAGDPSKQGDGNRPPEQEGMKPEPSGEKGENSGDGQKPEDAKPGAGGAGQSPEKDGAGNDPAGDQKGGSTPDTPKDPSQKPSGDKQPGADGAENPSDNAEKQQKASKGGREGDGGDRAGGGGEGKGQDSNQPGMGNPGSNTAADEGGEPSDQEGKGVTDPNATGQTATDQSTGQSGDKEGSGNTQTEAEGGKPGETPPTDQQRPNDSSGQQPPPSDEASQTDSTASNPNQTGSGQGAKPTGGGGMSPDGQTSDRPPEAQEPQAPDGSAPVEEYSKEAVDLALEYLEDQLARQEPSQELLDRLGWTRNDLDRFARQWKKMKDAAGQSGAGRNAAGKKYDDAIKSLGLRPSGTELKHDRTRTDSMRKTDSRRYKPPAKWAEQSGAYTRSIGKAPK